jgi:hypothetical protein
MRITPTNALVATVAVFAFGGLASTAAQAEPTFTKSGKAITSDAGVRYTGMWTRLWDYKQKTVIVCERAKGTGMVMAKGEATVSAGSKYTACTVHEAKLNATEAQYEEGTLLKCTVTSGGGVAGEIILPALKQQLVFQPKSKEEQLLLRVEPNSGTTFLELKIAGSECALAGTYQVTGSVLGKIETPNEEKTMGHVLFETDNAASAVTQRFSQYVLKEEEAATEDVIKFGANPAAFESTKQVELEPVSGLRGLFGTSL